MFESIHIPYDCVMMFNEVTLKPELSISDIELEIGEMCNVVKNTFSDDGFIAGQVFKRTGQVSEQGSIINEDRDAKTYNERVVIITYWDSFDQHEQSHADQRFLERFSELLESCDDAYEVAYELLWQGESEGRVRSM